MKLTFEDKIKIVRLYVDINPEPVMNIGHKYDGNKLIREKSINNTLDFLYDEYDNLYGFIKDNSEKYLYIRDQLQNIIGITDINGKIVVKYSYDAWGAIKSIIFPFTIYNRKISYVFAHFFDNF